MRLAKAGRINVEIFTLLMFIVFLFPFVLVFINSAKTAFEVTQYPLALPSHWSNIFKNIASIWTSPNIRYPASLLSSLLITVLSLVFINLLSSQAAWVLVRTKSRTSTAMPISPA